jgi:hypothetical protein
MVLMGTGCPVLSATVIDTHQLRTAVKTEQSTVMQLNDGRITIAKTIAKTIADTQPFTQPFKNDRKTIER